MLNIIFTKYAMQVESNNYSINPEVDFNFSFENEWMEDSFVKEMILDVDKSEVIYAGVIKSLVLDYIPPEKLSGGVKALILMYKRPDVIVNASYCGDNCAKWIKKIGEMQDITIRLGYMMFFDEPFKFHVENSDKVITTWEEFIGEYLEGTE